MDMPAVITQAADAVDFSMIREAADDAAPAIAVIKSTWDKESLLAILSGHIAVPDEVINKALAEHTADSELVRSVTLTSQEDGRLKVEADTTKIGRLSLTGTIDAFVHKDGAAYLDYTVKEKSLPDHKMMSWIFSRISLSMAQKFVGKVDLGDTLPTAIDHNTIHVDFQPLLQDTAFGKVSFMGYNLLDALVIEKAEPHEGYIEFTTALNIPEPVKKMLLNLLLTAI